jgi:hypothetical protein
VPITLILGRNRGGLLLVFSGVPNYRRKPLEWLHRWLRQQRMALLTAQLPEG